MKKRKNSFLAFCFSMIPGAGHMYIGFMKQGISIMTALVAGIALGVILHMPILTLFIPVLWFYAFFDVHNKRSLSEEKLNDMEDKFFLSNVTNREITELFEGKLRMFIAGGLILIGFYLLFDNLLSMMPYYLRNLLYHWGIDKIPHIIIACIIIYVGIRLIQGKRNEMFLIEEKERTGEDSEQV